MHEIRVSGSLTTDKSCQRGVMLTEYLSSVETEFKTIEQKVEKKQMSVETFVLMLKKRIDWQKKIITSFQDRLDKVESGLLGYNCIKISTYRLC